MNHSIINNRLTDLRTWMEAQHLDAFIIPSTDPHLSEYPPLYWQGRAWLTGFKGSAGTVVVTHQTAALWTDSRYFLTASQALQNSSIILMKEGLSTTPTLMAYLNDTLPNKPNRIGIVGETISHSLYLAWQKEAKSNNILCETEDPFQIIWDKRPSLPLNPIRLHPQQWAGKTTVEKLNDLSNYLSQKHATAIAITALDEIAWLLNLRGEDVHCNPVFLAYFLYIQGKNPILFIDSQKINKGEVLTYLKKLHIEILPYSNFYTYLSAIAQQETFLLYNPLNTALYKLLDNGKNPHDSLSPLALPKAIKQEAEIQGLQQAHLKDGIAIVSYLATLQQKVEKGNYTEVNVDEDLTAIRKQATTFKGLSFDTIAGYGANGAIVHYKAEAPTCATLQPKKFLLLDSGGQYEEGTTDLTRTIALGEVSNEAKKAYTLVLKGHIALARCKFPTGTTGTQLDLAARYALWQHGLQYGHGTGHGVGAALCVHEGPQQIRMNYVPTSLQKGMVLSNEPGLYVAGAFGIRIENVMVVKEVFTTDFGTFLGFEPLTLCPIDTSPLLLELMNQEEINYLNQYHDHVRTTLLPHLTDKNTITWLVEKTKPIALNS